MALYPVIHRVDGLKELEANLKILREEFGVKTGGVIMRGLSEGAKLIRDDAKRRAPDVDPSGLTIARRAKQAGQGSKKGRRLKGELGKSLALIRMNIVSHRIPVAAPLSEGRPTVLVRVRNRGYRRVNGKIRFVNPGSSPGYWWWIEFGTSRRPARPFMRPAFESRKGAAVEKMKQTMRVEIDKLFTKHFRRAA